MEQDAAGLKKNATTYPAPFVITISDRAGLIVVTTTFCLVAVWILFIIRTYIRLRLNGPWKLDDSFVAIATVLSTVRSGVVYLEVKRGYGKSAELLQPGTEVGIAKALFGDLLLYFCALFFSKCAVLLLCRRMTPKREHYVAITSVFVLASLWVMASILLVSIRCNAPQSWDNIAEHCPHLTARWKVICAVDIITEILMFCCAVHLVEGLHMSWKLKALVLIAFAIRFPTIAFSGLHLDSILSQLSSADPTYTGAVALAWRQFELDFSIVACTFSSLGAFLKPFDNEMGPSRTGSHHLGSQGDFKMSAIRSANGIKQGTQLSSHNEVKIPVLRPDSSVNTAIVIHPETPDERSSIDSNDSKKGIMMKKQWSVHESIKSSGTGTRF